METKELEWPYKAIFQAIPKGIRTRNIRQRYGFLPIDGMSHALMMILGIKKNALLSEETLNRLDSLPCLEIQIMWEEEEEE